MASDDSLHLLFGSLWWHQDLFAGAMAKPEGNMMTELLISDKGVSLGGKKAQATCSPAFMLRDAGLLIKKSAIWGLKPGL